MTCAETASCGDGLAADNTDFLKGANLLKAYFSQQAEEIELGLLQFSSAYYWMVSMRSEKPIIMPSAPSLADISLTVPLKQFQSSSD